MGARCVLPTRVVGRHDCAIACVAMSDDPLAALRALASEAREEAARAARAEHPDLLQRILDWANPRLGGEVPVESDDFYFCTEIAPAFEGRERARITLLDAELRGVYGDSTQNVIGLVIEAIGLDPDSAEAHVMLYDILSGNPSLVWEDAAERLPPLAPDARRFFDHLVERGACWQSGDPPFLDLSPRAGATLAEAEALAAAGKLAEAISARRGASGEDFPTARRAVCAG